MKLFLAATAVAVLAGTGVMVWGIRTQTDDAGNVPVWLLLAVLAIMLVPAELAFRVARRRRSSHAHR